MRDTSSIGANQPLTEATFFILLSLVPGQAHGYAILKDVQRLSANTVSLSTSTLYTALGRLTDQGWIERVDNQETADSGRPRKDYQLTGAGKSALESEMLRMQRMLSAAGQRVNEAAT